MTHTPFLGLRSVILLVIVTPPVRNVYARPLPLYPLSRNKYAQSLPYTQYTHMLFVLSVYTQMPSPCTHCKQWIMNHKKIKMRSVREHSSGLA